MQVSDVLSAFFKKGFESSFEENGISGPDERVDATVKVTKWVQDNTRTGTMRVYRNKHNKCKLWVVGYQHTPFIRIYIDLKEKKFIFLTPYEKPYVPGAVDCEMYIKNQWVDITGRTNVETREKPPQPSCCLNCNKHIMHQT
jgi:hypothetical protein